jgi:hypothetical protein
MTATATTTHRTLVSLGLPPQISGLTAYAQHIVTSMTGNATFPNPVPPLTAITSAINDFQVAESAVLARTKGTAATRNAKRMVLVQLLEQLKTYVQTVADAAGENGPPTVLGAGMAVRKNPVRKPRVFAATPAGVTGSVKLVAASAGRRAAYNWQYSLDGGKTWVDAASTLQAKATITGLTPGATVQFRYQPLIKTGEENWSQVVQLFVV